MLRYSIEALLIFRRIFLIQKTCVLMAGLTSLGGAVAVRVHFADRIGITGKSQVGAGGRDTDENQTDKR